MTYSYTTVNGCRVEVTVAAALALMDVGFRATTGYNLIVTNGTRTRAEQETIFRQRYVTAGNVNGRRVYDTRRWNGVLWYRISSAGTVAVPGFSNHEEDGPNGPRSIDIHDTGADRGVMTRGTVRDLWMAAHAADYQFENEGYKFGEPWHKTFIGSFNTPVPAPSAPASSAPAHVPSNPFGVSDVRGLQKIAKRYGGNTSPDNDWGPQSAKGFSQFLRANYGYSGNDTLGPVMWSAIARWLRARHPYGRYVGNDTPGPVMRAALERANTANFEQL